ncbi:hypothetical protein Ndes2526B_g01151 [Nannochloris sp. 'desiccata']|nr:hypothetical protein KSW81_004499 [Chlorella desiccata (nom. nud.)]
MDKDNAIIVFARHPTPGRVKTRLAAGVGIDGAARFYKHCAEKVIQECLKTDATTYIFFSAPEEEEQVRAWLSPLDVYKVLHFMTQVQSPDLGVRLADAIQRIFDAENCSHRCVAVIGSDIPDLESTHLNNAFEALEESDVVFGPAKDGGYYLCALNKPQESQQRINKHDFLRDFFEGIRWSTHTVLKQNVDNAIRLGMTVAPLATIPKLRDIDTIHDLAKWCHRDIFTNGSREAAEVMMEGLKVLEQSGITLEDGIESNEKNP